MARRSGRRAAKGAPGQIPTWQIAPGYGYPDPARLAPPVAENQWDVAPDAAGAAEEKPAAAGPGSFLPARDQQLGYEPPSDPPTWLAHPLPRVSVQPEAWEAPPFTQPQLPVACRPDGIQLDQQPTASGATPPVVPMSAGTRVNAEGGTQLWIPQSQPQRTPSSQPRNGHLRPAANARGGRPHDRGDLVPGSSGSVQRSPAWRLERSLEALEPIGEAEASAFAARFAADYLSWDEDDPTKRAEVLREYLADPRGATLGWSGAGRQRADVVLPGRTLRTSDEVIVVEVTVRVTTYQRTCPRPDNLEPRRDDSADPPLSAVGPSCAPPPLAEGWRVTSTFWARLAPPVTRDHAGRLVVDIGSAPDPDDPS